MSAARATPRRSSVAVRGGLLIVLAVLGASVPVLADSARAATPLRALAGARPEPGLHARAPAHDVLGVSFVLAGRDPAGEDAYAQQLAEPGSPEHGDYLSHAEFEQRFGPSAAEVRSVRAWATQSGLATRGVDGSVLTVRATAARLGAALHSTVVEQGPSSSGAPADFGLSSTPEVPETLAREISAVSGLGGSTSYVPLGLGAPRALERPDTSVPSPCTAASGAAAGDGADVLSAVTTSYGIGTLAGAGDTGTGPIGIFELASYRAPDVDAYASCFGIDPVLDTLDLYGGSSDDPDGTLEADLDIEQVLTQSPTAPIVIYESPNDEAAENLNTIVQDDAVRVVSYSWGECEPDALADGSIAAMEPLFEQADIQGQNFFVASGDDGSDDCGDATDAVSWPASSPYVTAVGGTEDASVDAATEAWSDGDLASGGGISSVFGEPGYQVADGISAPSGYGCGSACRLVPDVAADAGPQEVYDDYGGAGGWLAVEGTSAAAPILAGGFDDAQQSCSSPLDADSVLYGLAGPSDSATYFNDITSGSNGDFSAGVGYDEVTGLGIPNFAALSCPEITALSQSTGQPGDSVTISGDVAGATAVLFGTTPAVITARSADGLVATVPSGTGQVDVVVDDAVGAGNGLVFHYASAPTISSASSTTFVSGQAGTFTVTTGAGTYPVASLAESGALAPGVSFVDDGDGTATLAGTTTVTGSYPITISAANAVGPTATQSFVLVVGAPAALSSASHATATVGERFSFTVRCSSRTFPTAVVALSGALPSGLRVVAGNGMATVSGTPRSGGGRRYRLGVRASNGIGPPATGSLVITVERAALVPRVGPGSAVALGGRSPRAVSVTLSCSSRCSATLVLDERVAVHVVRTVRIGRRTVTRTVTTTRTVALGSARMSSPRATTRRVVVALNARGRARLARAARFRPAAVVVLTLVERQGTRTSQHVLDVTG